MLSDYISYHQNVHNKDIGLADLDPEYTPKCIGYVNSVRNVLNEVQKKLPEFEIHKLKQTDPVLTQELKRYTNKETDKVDKSIGKIPVK